MIWFDCTKSARTGHRSGLQRVATRLQAELGAAATLVSGVEWVSRAGAGDWFLTAEVFAPDERPGWAELMEKHPCRMAAIFHDAIPLKHPQITWPQSVARHPAYLKMLTRFDLVWAVSEASRRELLGYWAWLGLSDVPEVKVLVLGADFDGAPRVTQVAEPAERLLLCVGIIEPRKNQEFLLRVCESLWDAGGEFELHLVGRVNPHFGPPIVTQIKRLQRLYPHRVYHHVGMDDAGLAKLYARATAALFPTRAEGCGLPVIEALWRGVPCLCSDIPPVRENAPGGGAMLLPLGDEQAWGTALRQILISTDYRNQLADEAVLRSLPTWAETAASIRAVLTV